jgi:hypothetical protein
MEKFKAFGPATTVHHVGIAVRSIVDLYPEIEPIFDPIQKVKVAFLDAYGLKMELLEPVGEASPVYSSLSNGTHLQHICYEVSSIKKAVLVCRDFGFHVISPISPAVAIENCSIVWVFNPEYGLFELLECLYEYE